MIHIEIKFYLSGIPAKSKELLDSLKITEANTPKLVANNSAPKLNPVKQTLQFHEKSDSSANSLSTILSKPTKEAIIPSGMASMTKPMPNISFGGAGTGNGIGFTSLTPSAPPAFAPSPKTEAKVTPLITPSVSISAGTKADSKPLLGTSSTFSSFSGQGIALGGGSSSSTPFGNLTKPPMATGVVTSVASTPASGFSFTSLATSTTPIR